MKTFFVILLFLTNFSAHAQTLKVAFGNVRPPYIIEERGLLTGIELDVVKESLLLSGYKIEQVQLPTKRLSLAIPKMGFDIVVGVDTQDPRYYYSDEYIEFKNYAVAKSSRNLKLMSIENLKNYTVGAWPLAWQQCGAKYKALFSPNKEGIFPEGYFEPVTAESQNKMFWMDRIDVSVLNKMTFNYYKNFLRKTLNTTADVVYYDIFPDKVKYFVAFKDEKMRDDFNNGLAQLRRSKRYNRIFDSYIR